LPTPASPEVVELGIAADEAGEAAPGGHLQAGPRLTRPGHLVDLQRVGETLHRYGAKRLHLDVALGQRQRLRRDHDRPRIGDLLHPRGEVSGLPHCGVIHV
jgi:hypothetical protein